MYEHSRSSNLVECPLDPYYYMYKIWIWRPLNQAHQKSIFDVYPLNLLDHNLYFGIIWKFQVGGLPKISQKLGMGEASTDITRSKKDFPIPKKSKDLEFWYYTQYFL